MCVDYLLKKEKGILLQSHNEGGHQ